MPDRIPLVDAALRIKRSYNTATRLIMTGALEGGKDERGHWFVVRESLDRFLQREQTAREAANRGVAPLTAA